MDDDTFGNPDSLFETIWSDNVNLLMAKLDLLCAKSKAELHWHVQNVYKLMKNCSDPPKMQMAKHFQSYAYIVKRKFK